MLNQTFSINQLQTEVAKNWDPLNRRVEKIASRDDAVEQELLTYMRSVTQIVIIRLNEGFDVFVGDRRLVPEDDRASVSFKVKQITSRRYQFNDLDMTISFGHDYIEIDGLRHQKDQMESVFAKINSIFVGHFSPGKANGVFVRRSGTIIM